MLIILFPLKHLLKHSRRTITQIMQQLYDVFKRFQLTSCYAFYYFPNRNYESFKVLSPVIYHYFQTDYFKLRSKPINIFTNIKSIPVCNVTRSVNQFNSNFQFKYSPHCHYFPPPPPPTRPKKKEPTS